MRGRAASTVLALSIAAVVASASPARTARADEACAGGKTISDATDGHCCWPGQAWDTDTNRCFGKPRCPAGMDVDGHACKPGLPSLPKPTGSVTDPPPPIWVPPTRQRRAPEVEAAPPPPPPDPAPAPAPEIDRFSTRIGGGDLPKWPFVFVAGNVLLTTGYITGLFTAIPTASGCTHGSQWSFVPLVGPAIRVADFGPSTQNGNDCTSDHTPVVAVAIASEALQLGAIAAYTATLVMVLRTEPSGARKTSFMLSPGVAGAPMGATLSVVSF